MPYMVSCCVVLTVAFLWVVTVSTDLITKTPTKQTPKSPRLLSQDIIKCLGIVTVKQGQADATTEKSF